MIASTGVHAALAALAITRAAHGDEPAVDDGRAVPAVLVVTRPATRGTDELQLPAALPLLPSQPTLLALVPDAVLPPITRPAPAPAAVAVAGPPGKVAASLLMGRERIGALADRQVNEFPHEIDTPVRILDPIEVAYPAMAPADGAPFSVVVWAIVDADGTVSEVQVTEGDADVADAVVKAVKAARFTPATDRLLPIRFPIALEFRFGSDRPQAAAVTADAR